MMKRARFLLLALVMVIGLVPVSFVQAVESNDVVYVDESTSMSELVESGIVKTEHPVDEPSEDPTVPQLPAPTWEKPEATLPTVTMICDCGMSDADIYNHSDNCALRLYYLNVCGGSAKQYFGV